MEKNYAGFSVEDFLVDDAFIDQQLRPTPESTLFWDRFAAENTTQRAVLAEAVSVIQNMQSGLTPYKNSIISQEAKTYLLERIRRSNRIDQPFKKPIRAYLWLAAASLLIALGLMVYHYIPGTIGTKEVLATGAANNRIIQTNDTTLPIQFSLPDSSKVVLSPKSTLTFTSEFADDNRIVILSGEAEFDVTKKQGQPFLVMTNEITTKVLGTRFNVKAFESDEDITVTVQEGKVSVFTTEKTETSAVHERKGLILLPNQEAVFNRKTSRYSKELVATPQLLKASEKMAFDFNGTPVTSVFQQLEKAYGVEIEFDAELLEKCQLTVSFSGESLYEKIEIITQTIDGSFETVDGKIIVYSRRGCR